MAQPACTPESICPVVPGISRLKFRLQLVTVSDYGQEQVHEVSQFEREGLTMETLGLTLAEGKLILKNVQERVAQEQVSDCLTQQRLCPDCGQMRHGKGHHDVAIRTVFGRWNGRARGCVTALASPTRRRPLAR